MQAEFKTEQEAFWAGAFGNEYVDRNKNEHLVSGNIALFAKILACTENVRSVFEFGANIGLNLIAIKHLLPNAVLSAVEINKSGYALYSTSRKMQLSDFTVYMTASLCLRSCLYPVSLKAFQRGNVFQ